MQLTITARSVAIPPTLGKTRLLEDKHTQYPEPANIAGDADENREILSEYSRHSCFMSMFTTGLAEANLTSCASIVAVERCVGHRFHYREV